MNKPNIGFAWADDGMLKLARAVEGGVVIIADVCPVTHENVDHLIASLQDLKVNMREHHQKLH